VDGSTGLLCRPFLFLPADKTVRGGHNRLQELLLLPAIPRQIRPSPTSTVLFLYCSRAIRIRPSRPCRHGCPRRRACFATLPLLLLTSGAQRTRAARFWSLSPELPVACAHGQQQRRPPPTWITGLRGWGWRRKEGSSGRGGGGRRGCRGWGWRRPATSGLRGHPCTWLAWLVL
jgi:hypothetical protein